MAGRETLVKSVLTSQPIYHLTVFPLQNGFSGKLTNYEEASYGRERSQKSKWWSNWPTVCTPKDLGGLGILDLDRFARALRLIWQWHKWKSTYKLWANLDIPWDNTDRDLFNSSTIVRVGRGNK
jgi:hypothetical protein